MSALTVALSDESLRQLQALAAETKSTPEQLVQACVEEWLRRGKPDFTAAANYVLQKNAGLYRKLGGGVC